MKRIEHVFHYQEYKTLDDLPAQDRALLITADQVRKNAYAPYSHFLVGAALRLSDGTVITGNNQENAAFPAGLCAERVALFAAGANHPEVPIAAIAITAAAEQGRTKTAPAAPCGICRQAISEYEVRHQHPIKLIMGSMDGPIYVIDSAAHLLPLSFDASFLQKKIK